MLSLWRWRVISMRPSCEMFRMRVLALSRRTPSRILRDPLLVVAVTHVDEINDDQAADIAEAKLAADFLRRFEIGLENGRVQVLLRFVAARIDVDSHQRFGFIDTDVAARFQPDLAAEGVLDLFLDVEAAEDRRGCRL